MRPVCTCVHARARMHVCMHVPVVVEPLAVELELVAMAVAAALE